MYKSIICFDIFTFVMDWVDTSLSKDEEAVIEKAIKALNKKTYISIPGIAEMISETLQNIQYEKGKLDKGLTPDQTTFDTSDPEDELLDEEGVDDVYANSAQQLEEMTNSLQLSIKSLESLMELWDSAVGVLVDAKNLQDQYKHLEKHISVLENSESETGAISMAVDAIQMILDSND